MGAQMFVCLLVCGGVMEIQTPSPILMKFCTHCPRKVWCRFDPLPLPPGPRGPKTLKLKGTFLRCSPDAN